MTAPVREVNGRPRGVDLVKFPQPLPAPDPKPEVPAKSSTWRHTARVVWEVAWPASQTSGVFIVRHGLYLAGGSRVVWRRAWDARTPARYERMIRTAEAAGNAELAQEWEERANRFRTERHRRRMDMLRAPEQLGKSVKNATMVGVGSMLALGILLAVAEEDAGQVLAPWEAAAEFVRLLAGFAAVVWGLRYLLIAAAVCGTLLALWNVGRNRQTAPTWALPTAQRRTEDDPITPHKVVLALKHLGIPALKKAILAMEDGGAAMLSPIVLAGCGVEVDVTLPLEVTTEEVMAKRRKLAENLGRHEHETYPSVAPAARTVRLWVADSGALDEPIGPSPLVTDATLTGDYKNGRAPWGLNLRGDQVLISLYQMHVLLTGLSNQGKTAGLRSLALYLCLDPAVEFRIGDLKGVGDWRMFAGLATLLIEGPTDDHVMAVTEMVEAVFEEMQRRLQAPKGTVFPPLVVIVDEAQVAYGSGAVGDDKRPYGGQKTTSRYFQAVKGIHDQGRAVNVTIWEGTQDPTDKNLPARSRNGNHIRGAVKLASESQSAMALGEAPVKAGAAPHKLRQGKDKGQFVIAGDGVPLAVGQVSENVRTHFIDDDDAEVIADRGKAIRNPVATRGDTESAPPVDHLANIASVLGDELRMRTQSVLQLLSEQWPTVYRSWSPTDLKRVLDDANASPYKSDGLMVVSRRRVQLALAERREAAEESGSSPSAPPSPDSLA